MHYVSVLTMCRQIHYIISSSHISPYVFPCKNDDIFIPLGEVNLEANLLTGKIPDSIGDLGNLGKKSPCFYARLHGVDMSPSLI